MKMKVDQSLRFPANSHRLSCQPLSQAGFEVALMHSHQLWVGSTCDESFRDARGNIRSILINSHETLVLVWPEQRELRKLLHVQTHPRLTDALKFTGSVKCMYECIWNNLGGIIVYSIACTQRVRLSKAISMNQMSDIRLDVSSSLTVLNVC